MAEENGNSDLSPWRIAAIHTRLVLPAPPTHFFFFFFLLLPAQQTKLSQQYQREFSRLLTYSKGTVSCSSALNHLGLWHGVCSRAPPASCASFGSYNDSGQVASLLWASSAPWMVCLDISSSGWKVWIWAFFLSFTKAVSNGLQLNWYQIHCNEGQRHWDPAPVAVGFHYRCP